MRSSDFVAKSARIAILLLLISLPAGAAEAGSLTTLFNFATRGGINPLGGPLFDANGNVYGTASIGGAGCGGVGCGTVFELSGGGGGKWRQSVLYNFTGIVLCGSQPCYDGQNPSGTLVFDPAGALYGTTVEGGRNNMGTVFQLAPSATAGGKWTETVIYSFTGDPTVDGAPPGPDLVFGNDGNLYGVTNTTVFQLVPPSGSSTAWTFNLLASFPSGGGPVGGVAIGKGGVVYGVLAPGGSTVDGGVFSLTPPKSTGGAWRQKLIYAFPGNLKHGGNPLGGVVVNHAGALFGTTKNGGSQNDGVVFELKPPANGKHAWTEQVMHSFTAPPDGRFPNAPLTFGAGGVLYGTTSSGGEFDQFGTVFELVPPSTEMVLWSFKGHGPAASEPNAPVAVDSSGTVWGFTSQGGPHCQCGTFFMLTP
jgi:uncharacterized repeat protein (TIGR03803 family)